MDLSSKKTIQTLLEKYQAQPSKKLGQNFLIDKNIIKKFIEACDLKTQDVVLEVGPGTGILTQEIAKRAKKVIAVEKDPKMTEILSETLKDFQNINIIQEDIRKTDLNPYASSSKSYKVVGNLPFYLTAPLIRKFLELKNPPQEMILIIQKEVGQRIVAQPPDMNFLAVSVQVYAQPKIIKYISKNSFWPQPDVEGVIIKINPYQSQIKTSSQFQQQFFKIVKAGFSQPRKQLVNNFSKKLNLSTTKNKEEVKNWLLENNIQPSQRAETLSIKDWLKLTKNLKIE